MGTPRIEQHNSDARGGRRLCWPRQQYNSGRDQYHIDVAVNFTKTHLLSVEVLGKLERMHKARLTADPLIPELYDNQSCT